MVDGNVVDLLARAIRQGLSLVILVSAPALLASLIVGFVVSLLQVATQIHDPSVNFVPKLVTVGLILLLLGPALGTYVVRFAHAALLAIPSIR